MLFEKLEVPHFINRGPTYLINALKFLVNIWCISQFFFKNKTHKNYYLIFNLYNDKIINPIIQLRIFKRKLQIFKTIIFKWKNCKPFQLQFLHGKIANLLNYDFLMEKLQTLNNNFYMENCKSSQLQFLVEKNCKPPLNPHMTQNYSNTTHNTRVGVLKKT